MILLASIAVIASLTSQPGKPEDCFEPHASDHVACETGTPFDAPTNMVLFLLVGQSNMAGRAKPCGKEPLPSVCKLNRRGEWVVATSPIHFDRSTAGVGPVESFVRDYRRDHPSVTVGLVPCAVGGSGMGTWCVSSKGARGANLEQALVRARRAAAYGRFAGVLWHQGETDAKRADGKVLAARYPRQFESMVSAVRQAVGDPELPVIIGEIGRFNPDLAAKMNPVLNALPRRIGHCTCVSSEGLGNQDRWHFDKDAVTELGHRYYEGWKGLVRK